VVVTSIEIPDPVITTDYRFVVDWSKDDVRYKGEVTINSIVVFEGPEDKDSFVAEELALDGFAYKLKELLK
jgi:hypothetical protein